jgi:starvation-inducible outer membrane lipoprotein
VANTKEYMIGRKKYLRPQGLILANNPGYVDDGSRIPEGDEFKDFIILSDDSRESIRIAPQRIEKKERTVNGRMRSYHIADKVSISTSWSNLPSRAFNVEPQFSNFGGDIGKITNLVDSVEIEETERPVKSFGSPYFKDQQYTSDGGAGGAEILDWYQNNQGSFWVYLAYDNYKNLSDDITFGGAIIKSKYQKLSQYAEVVEVFFQSFDYSVESRGGNSHDFWTISLGLEEV